MKPVLRSKEKDGVDYNTTLYGYVMNRVVYGSGYGGLIINAKDFNNFHGVIIDCKNDKLKIVKSVNGKESVIDSVDVKMDGGKWYEVVANWHSKKGLTSKVKESDSGDVMAKKDVDITPVNTADGLAKRYGFVLSQGGRFDYVRGRRELPL